MSLFSLVGIAAAFALLAALVAWRRRLPAKNVVTDGLAALFMALTAMTLADALFVLSYPLDASPLWREAGSWALMIAPVASTVALRLRGRRSIPRALIVSAVALVALIGWLTLHLKGIRGGWTAVEIVLTTLAASAAVASAACLGWWSKPAPRTG